MKIKGANLRVTNPLIYKTLDLTPKCESQVAGIQINKPIYCT